MTNPKSEKHWEGETSVSTNLSINTPQYRQTSVSRNLSIDKPQFRQTSVSKNLSSDKPQYRQTPVSTNLSIDKPQYRKTQYRQTSVSTNPVSTNLSIDKPQYRQTSGATNSGNNSSGSDSLLKSYVAYLHIKIHTCTLALRISQKNHRSIREGKNLRKLQCNAQINTAF